MTNIFRYRPRLGRILPALGGIGAILQALSTRCERRDMARGRRG